MVAVIVSGLDLEIGGWERRVSLVGMSLWETLETFTLTGSIVNLWTADLLMVCSVVLVVYSVLTWNET